MEPTRTQPTRHQRVRTPVSADCRQGVGAQADSDLRPKKRRPPPQIFPAQSVAPTNDNVGAQEDLRWVAGILYATGAMSLAELADHPRLRAVSKRTIERWAANDRWQQERDSTRSRWKRQVVIEMGKALAAQRQEQLDILAGMFDDGVAKLKRLRPKTWEGVASATVRIGKLIDDTRAALLEDAAKVFNDLPVVNTTQTSADQDRPTILHPNLRIKPTEEEALAMAMALLDVRRKHQKEEFAKWEAEKADAERAKLEAAAVGAR